MSSCTLYHVSHRWDFLQDLKSIVLKTTDFIAGRTIPRWVWKSKDPGKPLLAYRALLRVWEALALGMCGVILSWGHQKTDTKNIRSSDIRLATWAENKQLEIFLRKERKRSLACLLICRSPSLFLSVGPCHTRCYSAHTRSPDICWRICVWNKVISKAGNN